MFCPKCGRQNEDNACKCVSCGDVLPKVEQGPAQPVQQSGKAVTSFVLSIIGIFVCPFIFSILAIILGFVARSEINNSGGLLTGEGLALAGIIIGFAGIALRLVFVSYFGLISIV